MTVWQVMMTTIVVATVASCASPRDPGWVDLPSTAVDSGEVVRIKSKEEIARTLDANKLNRGMGFEEEMPRFCGRTAKVLRR